MPEQPEIWKVSINGQVFQLDLPTLKQWVREGRVPTFALVSRDAQKWVPAEMSPALRNIYLTSPELPQAQPRSAPFNPPPPRTPTDPPFRTPPPFPNRTRASQPKPPGTAQAVFKVVVVVIVAGVLCLLAKRFGPGIGKTMSEISETARYSRENLVRQRMDIPAEKVKVLTFEIKSHMSKAYVIENGLRPSNVDVVLTDENLFNEKVPGQALPMLNEEKYRSCKRFPISGSLSEAKNTQSLPPGTYHLLFVPIISGATFDADFQIAYLRR